MPAPYMNVLIFLAVAVHIGLAASTGIHPMDVPIHCGLSYNWDESATSAVSCINYGQMEYMCDPESCYLTANTEREGQPATQLQFEMCLKGDFYQASRAEGSYHTTIRATRILAYHKEGFIAAYGYDLTPLAQNADVEQRFTCPLSEVRANQDRPSCRWCRALRMTHRAPLPPKTHF